ncbi:hypothetical protein DSO57_1012455 [Entomophthora muscae]|nr:hypothetical protein DSO57_1012455 [Entomophthora muscae]
MYGPITIKNLKPGKVMLYCRCGLSKDTPWCDNSHVGTPFKPMRWKVPEFSGATSRFSICHCKYTKKPPFCDGSHINLPLPFLAAQEKCQSDHSKIEKLCANCGFTPASE